MIPEELLWCADCGLDMRRSFLNEELLCMACRSRYHRVGRDGEDAPRADLRTDPSEPLAGRPLGRPR